VKRSMSVVVTDITEEASEDVSAKKKTSRTFFSFYKLYASRGDYHFGSVGPPPWQLPSRFAGGEKRIS
jgi:hypothetical protein